MGGELILFLLIIVGGITVSYFMMRATKKGRKYFYVMFGTLFTFNIAHLIYVLNLPPSGKLLGNLHYVIQYLMHTLYGLIFMLLFALIWMLVTRKRSRY